MLKCDDELFVVKKSNTDVMFALRELMEKYNESQKELPESLSI